MRDGTEGPAVVGVLDFRRYAGNPETAKRLGPYFSEDAFLGYLLKVEAALARVLSRRGICPAGVGAEVEAAAAQISAADVHLEQQRVRHPLMSVINCLRARVSDEARPFVHFTATTNDIVCAADACRYKDFTANVLLPRLIALERTLIDLARREKDTLQIGRTHGMHAEPITFGFAVAQFVSRLGRMILKIRQAVDDLRGKLSGAVGSYNAIALFAEDPQALEQEVLSELGLQPSPISTQIVEAEFLVDYFHALVTAFGVVANIADDMRQLHRSEIGEVEEFFGDAHVGSSTMPHKRNPSRLEHVKSLWKTFTPRMMTLYADQISEHQRDLTNFESTLFASEIACGLYVAADLLDTTLAAMTVRRDRMEQNFCMSEGLLAAEAAQLLLSSRGHREGHEVVRRLARKSVKLQRDFRALLFEDPGLAQFLRELSPGQRALLREPRRYVGIAPEKTGQICDRWELEIERLEKTVR